MKKRTLFIKVPGIGKMEVVIDRLSGLCAYGPTIIIESELDGKEALETVIHEYLHAMNPGAKEQYIQEHGEALANLLWQLGARVS